MIKLKILTALGQTLKKKDNTPYEKLEYSTVRSTIEAYCEQYLQHNDDILRFEALSNALDATLAALEDPQFQERYEFAQEAPTIFLVRLKEFNLLD